MGSELGTVFRGLERSEAAEKKRSHFKRRKSLVQPAPPIGHPQLAAYSLLRRSVARSWLVRQPSPVARRVYQGIAWRPRWNLVRELHTISRKLPILVCPTRHAVARWSDN
jgi:hypothetical protein